MAGLARCAVLLAFLLQVAWCRFVHDPRPTQTKYATDQFDFEWGWTPMPTAVPNVFDRLNRRQGFAPNNTCGFISGLSTSVLTCNNYLDCGFNSGYNAAGCCSGYTLVSSEYTLTNCDFFTACYDSTAVAASCDTACQSNNHNLQCTGNDQPYCITWSFTDIGYTNLGCYQFSGLTEYLAITYNAPSNPTTTGPASPAISSFGSTSITSPTSPSSPTTSSAPAPPPVVFNTPTTSSTPVSTAAATSSAEIAGAPGAVTANTASTGSSAGTVTDTATASGSSGSGSSSAQSTSHSSSNTGAIAGGVVGGVVGLAIIAALIGFFIRRHKKNGTGPPTPAEVSQHNSAQYPYSPVTPTTQTTSQYGSPQQAHEFPATTMAGTYNHPMDHPQSSYQPGQYNQAHEISSEGTGSSRPLNPGYSNAPEVVPQGGYRGVDPTGDGNYNPSASYGGDPGHYGRPYSEMP